MTLWNTYTSYVQKICGQNSASTDIGISFWSNRVFVTVVSYLIPLSIMALIPGIYFSVQSGVPEIAALDLFIFLTIAIIGLVPGMVIAYRKIIFMVSMYVLAGVLVLYLGAMGPGLIYLLACSVFGILIFPETNAYFWSYYNLAICILMGSLVAYGIVPNPEMYPLSVMYWVAVASNLVFLSFMTSALLPILFRGMQATLNNEVSLRTDLANERRNLVATLQELQNKNDELDQFAAVASHDLKEPARMVHSFVKLLDTRYSDKLDERARKYIQFAIEGSKRMLQLIEDVLNYTKAGNFTGQLTRVDTNMLVSEVLNNLSEVVTNKKAKIHVDRLPYIYAAQLPINLVFQNLIENAMKYSKSDVPPQIWISAEEHDDTIIFSVKDNGIGISREYITRIFDLFRRLHSQEEYQGTGLGLAICKKIIEQHGGQIWAESDARTGSTFHFSIPKS